MLDIKRVAASLSNGWFERVDRASVGQEQKRSQSPNMKRINFTGSQSAGHWRFVPGFRAAAHELEVDPRSVQQFESSVYQLPREDLERALDYWCRLRQDKQRRLPPKVFKEVQYLLKRYEDPVKSKEWAIRPRLFTILRNIDRLDVMSDFILIKFMDDMLPLQDHELPISLSDHKDAFIHAQESCLTDAKELEKGMLGKHVQFNYNGDQHFFRIQKLGSGGFGHVDKVWSRLSHKTFARKKFLRSVWDSRESRKHFEWFEREISTLKKVQHPHLVRILGSYSDTTCFAFLMSPVANCNLSQYLQSFRSRHRLTLKSFYGCLAEAVTYLHRSKIYHMDIKSDNILVKGTQVYLADFGAAHDWTQKDRSTTCANVPQTRRYMPPEQAKDPFARKDYSVDIWSLGVVFLEMTTILKGAKMKDLSQHLRTQGSRHEFVYGNSAATYSWLECLRMKDGPEFENAPLFWIKDMLAPLANRRPYARQIRGQIFQVPGFYCDHCGLPDGLHEQSSEHSDDADSSGGSASDFYDAEEELAVFEGEITPPAESHHESKLQSWIDETQYCTTVYYSLRSRATSPELPFDVVEDDDFEDGRPMNRQAFNIQIPQKLSVLSLLDDFHSTARLQRSTEQEITDELGFDVLSEASGSSNSETGEPLAEASGNSVTDRLFLELEAIEEEDASWDRSTQSGKGSHLPEGAVELAPIVETCQEASPDLYDTPLSPLLVLERSNNQSTLLSSLDQDLLQENTRDYESKRILGLEDASESGPFVASAHQIRSTTTIAEVSQQERPFLKLEDCQSNRGIQSPSLADSANHAGTCIGSTNPETSDKSCQSGADGFTFSRTKSGPEDKDGALGPWILTTPREITRRKTNPKKITILEATRPKTSSSSKLAQNGDINSDAGVVADTIDSAPESSKACEPTVKKKLEPKREQVTLLPPESDDEVLVGSRAEKVSVFTKTEMLPMKLENNNPGRDSKDTKADQCGGKVNSPKSGTQRTPSTSSTQPLTTENLRKINFASAGKQNQVSTGAAVKKKRTMALRRQVDAKRYMRQICQEEADIATSILSENTRARIKGLPFAVAVSGLTGMLEQYIKQGKVAAVRALLEAGCNPGTKDKPKIGPLLTAVKGKSLRHNKCVEALLSAGADVNIRTRSSGKTMLSIAIEHEPFIGYRGLIWTLLHYGANPNLKDKNGDWPLLQILYGGYKPLEQHRREALALILNPCRNLSTNVNVKPPGTLNTPLHLAVRRKDPWAVGMLLAKGANSNAKNGAGLTPFMATVNTWGPKMSDDLKEVARQLLVGGADPNEPIIEDANGITTTALHSAIRYDLPELVEMLIAFNANPAQVDQRKGDAYAFCRSRQKDNKLSTELAEKMIASLDLHDKALWKSDTSDSDDGSKAKRTTCLKNASQVK